MNTTDAYVPTKAQVIDIAKSQWQTGHSLVHCGPATWTVRNIDSGRTVGLIEFVRGDGFVRHDAFEVTRFKQNARSESVVRTTVPVVHLADQAAA